MQRLMVIFEGLLYFKIQYQIKASVKILISSTIGLFVIIPSLGNLDFLKESNMIG